MVPPNTETGSPIRDVVQQPLSGSEGQGTSKVVSIRPEGTLTPGGQPIEQGTPQSSRIGPISIGGSDVPSAPIGTVAANEPGTAPVGPIDPRIPNAPSQIKSPSLGTTIKAAAPQTAKGQRVIDYSFSRDKQQADVTDQAVKDAISRGERSTAETLANSEALGKQYDEFMGGINEDISDYERHNAVVAYANNPSPENRAAYLRAIAPPTPKPTPAPSQGGYEESSSGGSSSGDGGSSSGGQVQGASTVNTPGLKYLTPQAKKVTFTQAPAVNIPKAVQSGGLTVSPKPAAKAPSIGTSVIQSLKKLFGF